MSIESIKKYNDKIKKAQLDGLDNEENIREYFYELLKNYTKNMREWINADTNSG